MQLGKTRPVIDTGKTSALASARYMLADQAAALSCLAEALDEQFLEAGNMILSARGRLVVSGLGKSGLIGRKIAATFSSTGTPALFVHLAEALHGDLGAMTAGDVALLVSHSGETPELRPVIRFIEQLGVPLIGISSNPRSMLMRSADACLLLPAWNEADGLTPTTSTLLTQAVGDALAMTVMSARNFGPADFRQLHPGGTLGARLRPVSAVMHRDGAIPLVAAGTPMLQAILEMTAKRLGVVGVIDQSGLLAGVITDGDLRRHVESLPSLTAQEIMSPDPKIVLPDATGDDALELLSRHRITSLFVVDDLARPRPIGIVHIHDLPYAGDAA